MIKYITKLCLMFSFISCAGTLDHMDDYRASSERGEDGVQSYERTQSRQGYRNYKENEEVEKKKKANLIIE